MHIDAWACCWRRLAVVGLGAVPPRRAPSGESRRARPRPRSRAGPWINSEPLSLGELRGRVVVVEFWTYG